MLEVKTAEQSESLSDALNDEEHELYSHIVGCLTRRDHETQRRIIRAVLDDLPHLTGLSGEIVPAVAHHPV